MDRKADPYNLRDPGQAPEVAPSQSPIPVFRESEGLQPAFDHSSGKEAYSPADAHYGNDAVAVARRPWYRRKRWIICIVIAVVAIIAVAVGAGVGASSGGNESQSQGQSQDTPSTTTTGSDPASSTSSAAVAPATSGIASFDCSNGTTTYSAQPDGLAYIEFCNTVFYYNTPDIYAGGQVAGLYSSTKYSFQACVNSCDDWNSENPDAEEPCMALSYYANLTNVFTEHKDWRGNCILKSGVGGVTTNSTTTTDNDWQYSASAYRACLQAGGITCNSS